MEQVEVAASDMVKEFEEKIQYAQHIITILQTRLNESLGQSVQFEATITMLKAEKEKLTKELADGKKETSTKESVDGSNNKTEKK
tara:strand:+ start:441 stop:695 length:255 start_codon:yes stop_codon:yes gene_type:complete